jgi:hypothetical protein
MREHLIPQDITSYRFHIIGSMTLKQFAELAAGALLGLLIFKTNLPDVIKWPLIFSTVGLGAAAAFLPIEERPLDHWVISFIKAMHKPTKYFWKRSAKIPAPFLYEPGHVNQEDPGLDLSPARRQRIKDYLYSVGTSSHTSDYSQEELAKMKQILAEFNNTQTLPSQTTPTTTANSIKKQKPKLKIEVRSLLTPLEKTSKVMVYDQTQQIAQESKKVAPTVQIPVTEATKVEKYKPEEKNTNSQLQNLNTSLTYIKQKSDQENQPDQLAQGQSAIFNIALPFPSKPDTPNKLVGMLLTPNNELIPDAIIEIKDKNNHVVRAIKSNALGQFFVTTALKNGTYFIQANHDQYQFPSQKIVLENKLVDPIEIRSLN